MIGIALRDVAHYRREAVGVVAQVAVGLALFIVALSFVAAIGQNADRLLFGTVGAPWLIQPTTSKDVLTVDASTLSEMSDAVGSDSIRSRLNLSANVENPSASADRPASGSVTLVGADLAAEHALGENFGLPPERLGVDRIVLADKVARQLDVTTGDAVIVSIGAARLDYTVDAVVTASTPNFILEGWVIVDRQALARKLYGDADRTNALLIDAPQTSDLRAELAAAASRLPCSTTIFLWSDTSWSSLMLGPTIWGIVLVAASTFTFLIICIGLSSLVYSAMLSRVADIAVLKTSGAPPGSLRRMYVMEVVAQYLVGYVVGAILAGALMAGVNAVGFTSTDQAFTFAVGSTTLVLVPTWWVFLGPLGIGFVVTVAVLWFPIRSLCAQPVLDLLEIR